jgi:hypothetical protein
MAQLDTSLREAMEIDGALGVALVDVDSGGVLGSVGGGPDLDLERAATGNAGVVKAKLDSLDRQGVDDTVDDVVVTLDTQVHLIRRVSSVRGGGLFFYLALDRGGADVASARRQLGTIEAELSV